MKVIAIIATYLVVLLTTIAYAQYPETIERAEELSIQQGKPILLEFFREDCEYCQLAAREKESKGAIIEAYKTVVRLLVNIKKEVGVELTRQDKVGNHFPVFFL